MRHKSGTRGSGSEQIIRTIKRKIRRQYSAEEKIRIVLDGLRREARDLKECVADLTLENRLLKISMIGDGEDIERDILHLKSWRLSGLSSDHICLPR